MGRHLVLSTLVHKTCISKCEYQILLKREREEVFCRNRGQTDRQRGYKRGCYIRAVSLTRKIDTLLV